MPGRNQGRIPFNDPLALAAWILCLAAPAGWASEVALPVGTQVVLKSWDTPLRVGSEIVRSRPPHRTFAIERAQGGWIWIVARDLRGWVEADSVIPLDQAPAYFDEAIRLRPDDVDLRFRRAYLRENAKVYEGAIADFGHILRIRPDSDFARYGRGMMHARKRELDLALADFDEALKLDPASTKTLVVRAWVYRQSKDLPRALADTEAALRIDPRDAGAYRERGCIRHEMGDDAKAIANLDLAVRLAPDDPEGLNDRAGILSLQGLRLDQAIADADQAIRLAPGTANYWNTRGGALAVKGRPEDAVVAFNEAIRLDPNDPQPFRNRARAWEATGRIDLALADEAAVLRLRPDDPWALGERAWQLATAESDALRDGREAVALADRLREKHGDKCVSCLAVSAAAHAEVGDFEAARRFQGEALNLLDARAEGRPEAEARLALYRSDRPYRDVAKR